MTDSFFQKVYNIIQPILPEKWKKIVLYSAFMQESCEIKFFIKVYTGTKFRDCFEIIDNHNVLFNILYNLGDVIFEERIKLEKKEQWNFVTITIDSDGNFETFYDYSDSFWVDQDYMTQWSNTYLK